MSVGRRMEAGLAPHACDLALVLAMAAALSCGTAASAADSEKPKLAVVIYPDTTDGAPGAFLTDRAIRSTFAAESPGRVEVRNEYVDTSRLRDTAFKQAQVALLRQKYAGRKIDLVIAGLSSGLDFVLEHRNELFPGVPVVFVAVDGREVRARRLPPDVIGAPIQMDLTGTLDLALRLHPNTQRVFVIAGSAPFDTAWEAEARAAFRSNEHGLDFSYLTGLPMDDLLGRVADLPERSLIYYLHITQDGTGKTFIPAEALDRLAARANAPIYGHVDTYVGRGAVGGRVFTFEAEGKNAARLGLRLLAGERPESIAVPEEAANANVFDWRQLKRWGITERSVPPGSVVRYKEPTFWDAYRWPIIGVIAICVVEALLIAGLLVQRQKKRRAEDSLRASQRELKLLTGRLIEAQEGERRRVARELHDDVNQTLALLSVEIDLLGQRPPKSTAEMAEQMREISDRVKELSSSVHDLSHQLHPSKLEHLGLVPAVEGLCKELKQHHDLEVKFTHLDVPEVIPEAVALCLYRIVQEALRNIVKHGGTDRAAIDLRGALGEIHLRVSDDGAGFTLSSHSGNGGLGLVSMRERLHLVGGEIAIDSRPSGGTRINVRVPAPAPTQPEAPPQADAAGELVTVTSFSTGEYS